MAPRKKESSSTILWFDEISMKDVPVVGGKNASLGEMIGKLKKSDIKVPYGFATTAESFRTFLCENQLTTFIEDLLAGVDVHNVSSLKKIGRQIRDEIMEAKFNQEFKESVEKAYKKLIKMNPSMSFAVRSSATAEDLPSASFAGQQETYLNIKGIDATLHAIKKVFASLYNDRAIAYRIHHQFDHSKVAISAGIQQMVRSDLACSGVLFTIDTESGFDQVVFITGSYGLGETIVQGSVNPDEFYLYKPNIKKHLPAVVSKTLGEKAIKMIYADKSSEEKTLTVNVSPEDRLQFILTDDELEKLARMAVTIEKHYKMPMDIEWAKDGLTNELFIVQARPETVKSQQKKTIQLEQYHLEEKGKVIVEGRSIGRQIGQGKATVLNDASEILKFEPGSVLVTDMTDPDWEPIMKKSAAIVTNKGGRTCHAAIVARELGIPAVVGCKLATTKIRNKQNITVSCDQGDIGYVYDGLLKYSVKSMDVDSMPKLPTKIMINMANPEQAFTFSLSPNYGVGLARLEFIINSLIGIHPNALLNYSTLKKELRQKIDKKIAAYSNPVDFYVMKLVEGISTIACAFNPKPVIVRLSDFKSNEYANLLGGNLYEPKEENPMIGFRGASRYVDDHFKACFELECQAVKIVRDKMKLTNVEVMIPFVRTVDEAKSVIKVLNENGLKRGKNDLKLIMMCEIPSNAILAEEFLELFDGFSIGSNDLTQLTLGLDRDSSLVAGLFDERNEAVKTLISKVIKICRKKKKYIGICGQAPSDYPDFAQWLFQQKIETMSLNPDTVVSTWLHLAE